MERSSVKKPVLFFHIKSEVRFRRKSGKDGIKDRWLSYFRGKRILPVTLEGQGVIYRVFLFIAFLMICLVVTGFGPLFTDTGSGSWYDQLQNPFISFPGSLFGPVSMLFSLLIAFSGWSIWHSQDTKERRVALLFWIVQFILYGIWNGLFFVLRQPGMALLEILLLWFAIGGFVIAAWKVRRLAAFSFFFYWFWITFVTLLNLNIWWQN